MADTFLFPQGPRGRSQQVSRRSVMLNATIRDFSGGWNSSDNDLNLSSKYAVKLENIQNSIDNTNSIRPGTRKFADTSEYLDDIINVIYYNTFLIAVGANGKVVKVDANGIVSLIWDDNIASSLAGSPLGWATTSFVSFAIFNGDLIICNGINKPLIVDNNLQCSFLKDLADNSNANTPIARFVLSVGRYLIMAGSLVAGEEDLLYISATDTSGTWLGDSGPNDAVNLNLGSRVPSGDSTIKGLGRFRDNVMIMFDNAILPGTLGSFVESDHVPQFNDAIENVGSISHRSIQTISEDMMFADSSGVGSANRALFTGSVTSTRASQLIDPDYRQQIGLVSSIVALEDRAWSLWDNHSDNYMLFLPNGNTKETTTETRCFVYKNNRALKKAVWSDWRNWNFSSGCVSTLKRVFFTEDALIYILGEEHEGDNIYKDYERDQEMFDDNTPYDDYTGFTPHSNNSDSGVPIPFDWEFPWSDNNQRFLTKNSRYINFDTVGENKFTSQMFIDNIYLDRADRGEDFVEDVLKFDDDLGWDVDVLDPTLELDFEGGTAPGYGNDGFGDTFGGGRPTRLEQLYAWNSSYKLNKFRLSGDGTKELKFVSISYGYLTGSIRR